MHPQGALASISAASMPTALLIVLNPPSGHARSLALHRRRCLPVQSAYFLELARQSPTPNTCPSAEGAQLSATKESATQTPIPTRLFRSFHLHIHNCNNHAFSSTFIDNTRTLDGRDGYSLLASAQAGFTPQRRTPAEDAFEESHESSTGRDASI